MFSEVLCGLTVVLINVTDVSAVSMFLLFFQFFFLNVPFQLKIIVLLETTLRVITPIINCSVLKCRAAETEKCN
jgi:hypothetical protein